MQVERGDHMMSLRHCPIVLLMLLLLARPVFSQPGVVTLITPTAEVTGTTIAFSWQSTAGATWYQLWLGTPTASLVMEQWYTADNAGCASGGTCTVVLTPPVGGGAFVWYIRAWAPSGYGQWSGAKVFTMKDPALTWGRLLAAPQRFVVVLNGEGVLDNETGLVWWRNATQSPIDWIGAVPRCIGSTAGGRAGWRLPKLSELRSLTDFTGGPSLGAGHPFTLPATVPFYWTDTPHSLPDYYWVARPTDGNVEAFDRDTTSIGVWCVRGGTSTQ
jgi:hypothetical protein